MERDLEKSCVHDYSQDYLTFVALEDGTFRLGNNAYSQKISYSLDNGVTWTNLAENEPSPIVSKGNKIMWKGNLVPEFGIGSFSSTGRFDVQGNAMSLLYGDDFKGQTSLAGKRHAFCELFNDNKNVANAEDLSLPATKLVDFCYSKMFSGCTSLTTAPALPATELAHNCYESMFYACTSLTSAPALPATNLSDKCYWFMFEDCTSLTTAPALPATKLVDFCYREMFSGCTSLTTAPALPATELAGDCYMAMFDGCTSLTTAPALPATELASNCYMAMFVDCTSLTEAPALPATELAHSCYQSMFFGCTSLTEAPALPATKLAECCYSVMLSGTDLLPDCRNIDFASESVVQSGGLSGLFAGTKVTDSDLEKILPKDGNGKYCLPVMNLADRCYEGMFGDCTSLTTAPALPATELAKRCYFGMFYGCTSLTEAPALPATKLAEECYGGMLGETNLLPDCTNIDFASESVVQSGGLSGLFAETNVTDSDLEKILPKDDNGKYCLPVMNLTEGCYERMFDGCSNLTTAPALPATKLAERCYFSMFYGCTSLTEAPALHATKLDFECYNYMFEGCTSLNYIKAMFTENPSIINTKDWVKGVAESGTFVKNSAATWTTTDDDVVPIGWTIETASE